MSKPIILTPMLQQYLSIKEQHPDAILFYRMGDFYEFFFEDAKIASKELDLTLTSRNSKAENPVPMCGFPYHAVDDYLRQLLNKGFCVAICEQVEDPKSAVGLVKREVIRILTPGTVINDNCLNPKINNFLGAIYFDAKTGGAFTWLDFSTGQWLGIITKNQTQLWQWVIKIAPKELISAKDFLIPKHIENEIRIIRQPLKPTFDLSSATNQILKNQKIASLSVLDIENKPIMIRACGAILNYLYATQKQELNHLSQFTLISPEQFLYLDEITERNLEIFQRLDGKSGTGTLWHIIDYSITPMGGRLLANRLQNPFRNLDLIKNNQKIVKWFFENDNLRDNLRLSLNIIFDLERLSTRIFLNRSTPKDFLLLAQSISNLPLLQKLITKENAPKLITQLLENWDNLTDLSTILNNSLVENPPQIIVDGGLFIRGYDQQLDELIELSEYGEQKLNELLSIEQKNLTGKNAKLKLGFNRIFGYYFELSNSFVGDIPKHFIRKQTVTTGERYITENLKLIEDKIFNASEKRKQLEYNLFLKFRDRVAQERSRLMHMAHLIAQLDLWQSLAFVARKFNWCAPIIHSGLEINIKDARHPVVETLNGRANYVPSDLVIDNNNKLLLITGPNMSGKSTILRASALIILLAQAGGFVPATQAKIGLCDRIFSRVGASDNLSMGQSTFMVEMLETARILRQSGKNAFIILDEIGRGTSTFDGLSLAWAIVEELATKFGGIRTLFATHYHELTALETKIPTVKNYNIAVKEWKNEIIFLHRLIPGPSDRSYGIEVARLAGVPEKLINRAKIILHELETHAIQQKNIQIPTQTKQGILPGFLTTTKQKIYSDHPFLNELENININNLTPLEALQKIQFWQENWKKN